MATAAAKLCCICKKDVSTAKRVKDARGNYYCQPCHEAAARKAAASTSQAPRPAPPAPSHAAAPTDEYDIASGADIPPRATAKTVALAAANPPAPSKPKPLPEFCPNCGAKVLPYRKFCIKCQRDVTQMDKVIAWKAEEQSQSKEEKVAVWIGRSVRIGIALFIIAFIAFSAWGLKMFFAPGGAWDGYPTTREAVVRDFLAEVAKGSDKGYDNAFLLVSLFKRTTNNEREELFYTAAYRKMHDDFVKKYGNDWLSKAKIKNRAEGPDVESLSDFTLTLDNDDYHITTQVQVALQDNIGNLASPRFQPTYPENGKNHFGIYEVEEYPAHEKKKDDHKGGGIVDFTP